MKGKLTTREIALMGVMTALLVTSVHVMAPIPNVEPVTLLIILYTLFFEKKVVFIIAAYVLLEGCWYGFGIWWAMYLYIWPLLAFLTYLFRKRKSVLFWSIFSGAYGLFFGALCAVTYFFTGGAKAAFTFWVSGIPFDIVHGVSNAVLCLMLFLPLREALRRLKREYALEGQRQQTKVWSGAVKLKKKWQVRLDKMAEEKEIKNPVQSAERIFQVMETLADKGEMGLMELSAGLGLHKSTVHRLLMSLIYMGYAKQDMATQKYMLTYKVVGMAGKLLDRMDILQVARPYLERLSDISGETVHLVSREGNRILYIYKIEAKIGTIRMVSHVGMTHPMYCSGVGKAIMAALPEKEVRRIWNESIIERKTDKTITDYEEMQSVLEEVRKNGYALDDEENEKGVRCIAAAVRDGRQEARYAFSISGPTSRMTKERVEELSADVKKVRQELSQELGYCKDL